MAQAGTHTSAIIVVALLSLICQRHSGEAVALDRYNVI